MASWMSASSSTETADHWRRLSMLLQDQHPRPGQAGGIEGGGEPGEVDTGQ